VVAGCSAVDVGPTVREYRRRNTRVRRAVQQVWIAAGSRLREVFEGVAIQHLVDGDLPSPMAAPVKDDDAWRAAAVRCDSQMFTLLSRDR
jgi:hypothetical protein